ncbi:MAG: hypothetical protein ABFE02_04275 [Sulfuricella sp.]
MSVWRKGAQKRFLPSERGERAPAAVAKAHYLRFVNDAMALSSHLNFLLPGICPLW